MGRPVTFVHAADLHLDAPFAGVDANDERVRAALMEATYIAFDRVIATCIEADADFLVLAGDTYNSSEKSLRAQLRFQVGMRRLAEAGIPTYVLQGNHDPANGWSAGLEMPSAVHVFPSDRVERLTVERDGETICALYGRGFAAAVVTENLAAGYKREPADRIAIGVLHANVGGDPEYEPYAPCSIDDLRAAGMDYWALGHIHKHTRLAAEPRAVYAGSPQGLSPKEAGEHGCYLVTIGPGNVEERFIVTDAVRWARDEIDVSEMADVEALRTGVRAACERQREAAGGRPVIVRLGLTGRGPVHADLARPGLLGELIADVSEGQLASEPWVWIARARDLTRPAIDLAAVREGGGFAGDLVQLADDLLAGDPDTLVDEVLAPLRERARGLEVDSSAAEIIERARDVCLDLLYAAEDRS
ncbi:MAG: DNA repair exonuclease [Actinomycetota bacterium]|nr:DNA repair exonuclease [Actinomycetota bacterium]